MSDIKVSVVMATYNHSQYIEKALRSAVSQKVNFKYEIVVGDDASLDDTAQIVARLYNEYPDIVIPVLREENLGAMSNVEDLLSRCNGEYIAFLEGDDFWISSEKLQKQVDFLDENSEYVACYHKNIKVDENGKTIVAKDDNYCKHHDYTIEEFSDFVLPGHTATMLVRKSVFENLYKNTDIQAVIKRHRYVAGDKLLSLYLLIVGKVYCFDDVMSAYRCIEKKNGTNFSSKYSWKKAYGLFFHIREIYNFNKIEKKLNIQVSHANDEVNCFKLACWNFVVLKRISYIFNIMYMLIFSNQRKKLIHYAIQETTDLKNKVKKSKEKYSNRKI